MSPWDKHKVPERSHRSRTSSVSFILSVRKVLKCFGKLLPASSLKTKHIGDYEGQEKFRFGP